MARTPEHIFTNLTGSPWHSQSVLKEEYEKLMQSGEKPTYEWVLMVARKAAEAWKKRG